MKRDYCLCDLTEVETLKKKAVVNTIFLFGCGECIRRLLLGTASNIFKLFKT